MQSMICFGSVQFFGQHILQQALIHSQPCHELFQACIFLLQLFALPPDRSQALVRVMIT